MITQIQLHKRITIIFFPRQEERQKERWAVLPPIIKNFYKEDPAIANMSESRVAHIRKTNNNIEVRHVFENKGGSDQEMEIPNPIETFEQAFQVM